MTPTTKLETTERVDFWKPCVCFVPAFALAALPLLAVGLGRLRESESRRTRELARVGAFVVLCLVFNESFVLGPVAGLLVHQHAGWALAWLLISQPLAVGVVWTVVRGPTPPGAPEETPRKTAW